MADDFTPSAPVATAPANPALAPRAQAGADLPLVARLTPWYWKRALVTLAVVVLVALYFVFDGWIGYPKKNAKLEAGIEKRAQIWSGDGSEQEKQAAWTAYTATVGLNDKHGEAQLREQLKSPAKIREQFYYAGGLGAVALAMALWQLRQRGRTLELHPDGLKLPSGEKVPFAAMQRVDRRKWHRGKAGLAYLFYQSGGETKRATIDGLKFGGFHSQTAVESAAGAETAGNAAAVAPPASVPEQILDGILLHEHIELLDLASQVQGAEGAVVEPAVQTAGPPAAAPVAEPPEPRGNKVDPGAL